MNLTLTLPDAVHTLLAAHPKGAEAAVLIAIKRYLKATASEGRDQAIADESVRGATYAALANKYDISISRVQQLVALGRDAALLRNPPAPTPAHTTTSAIPAAKPQRQLTAQDIHNIRRMDAEGAMQSEIMAAFGITMDALQTVLWSEHTTTTTTTTPPTRNLTESHTTTSNTLHGIPLPSHDFDLTLDF